jgi:hypothetical protein
MSRPRTLLTAPLLLLTAVGCRGSLSPLSNRIAVGDEAYLIFAADAPGAGGDLFASSPAGGRVFQVTFTPLDERAPALSPHGELLAFIRAPSRDDTAQTSVWVMNLLNGDERRLTAPGLIKAIRLAWSTEGTRVYIRTDNATVAVEAPPSPPEVEPLLGPALEAADSALAVELGDPPVARAVNCADSPGLCAVSANGEVSPLTREGVGPVRWGPDSVGYLVDEVLAVRPLAGGTVRRLNWSRPPSHPREVTYWPGRGRPR